MSTLLLIFKAVVQYRTLLFPAVVGFISAVAIAIGWKVDIGKVQAVVNATGILATALAPIIGYVMDANNRNVRSVVNKNAEQLDTVTPPEVVSAKLPPVAPVAEPPKETP